MELNRFEWLAQRVEEPIDPNRAIVDPHHHLWDNRGGTYLAEELLADTTAGHNVVKTVFVECRSKYDRDAPDSMQPVGETRFVARQAAMAAAAGRTEIAGIVSHADMMLGDSVEEVLAAHDGAGNGLFRGIRHAVSLDPHPDIPVGHNNPAPSMMATPQFHAGVATLGRMDFSFDAWLYHPQLPQLLELARAVPETSIILNHLGGPLGIGPYADDRAGAMATWRASMTDVAGCDNVTLKVGGIGMDGYYGLGWTDQPIPPDSDAVVAAWQDRVHFSIDTFGPDRCMFESNFPVDRQALTYPVLWNALQKMAAPYSDAEQDQLFSGTATRVYRLSA
ncbi:MAG: amidohydrolase family protein [Acidimicrobiales bacterium]